MQKWHNAFDEAIRVPLLVSGPGIDTDAGGRRRSPTSHVDLIPTLLGLAGVDVEAAAAEVSRHHVEAQPLSGRDLSRRSSRARRPTARVDAPVYFMTEDEITLGLRTINLFTGEAVRAGGRAGEGRVGDHARSRRATTASPSCGSCNHYYDRLDDTDEATPWELHNLTVDPEERVNRASDTDAATAFGQLRTVLETRAPRCGGSRSTSTDARASGSRYASRVHDRRALQQRARAIQGGDRAPIPDHRQLHRAG